MIKKRFSFFAREKFEQPQDRIQEHIRVADVDIGSSQEVSTDHF
jgi:hypothetical protein